MVFMSSSKPSSQRSKLPSNSSSPSPDKDTDSTSSPESSVFQKGCQRFCSSLVLFSFLFQTLWPSLAFSMDDPAGALDSPLPASRRSIFKGGPFDESLRDESLGDKSPGDDPLDLKNFSARNVSKKPLDPYAAFTFLSVGGLPLPSIDQTEEAFSATASARSKTASPPSVDLKTLKDPMAFQAFAAIFQKLYPLYQGMNTFSNSLDPAGEIDGILWKVSGLQFVLTVDGQLCVTGNPSHAVKALRINNANGLVVLGRDLNIEHLLVKAKEINHTGKKSLIKTLDVWVMGGEAAGEAAKGDTTGVTEAAFSNKTGAHLHATNITMHEGNFDNEGEVILREDGIMDLNNHDLLNKNKITAGKDASIQNIKTLDNGERGIIEGVDDNPYHLHGTTLNNAVGGQLLGMRSLDFVSGVNQGFIASSSLYLMVHELFTNTQEGIFKVKRTLSTKGRGKIEQRGAFEAKTFLLNNAVFEDHSGWEQTYTDVTIGERVTRWILGKDSTWTTQTLKINKSQTECAKILNEGILNLRQKFTNHARSFINTGDIKAKLFEQGNGLKSDFTNEAEASLEVETEALFNTMGEVLNKGSLTVKGKTTGHIDRLINENSLQLEGGTLLTGTLLSNTQFLKTLSGFSWKGQTLVSDQKSKWISDRTVSLEVQNDYTHLGKMKTQDLLYKGGQKEDGTKAAFNNQGTLIATSSAVMEAKFNNTATGVAHLTGLDLDEGEDVSMPFSNQGEVLLRKVRSLGKKNGAVKSLRDIVNGSPSHKKAKFFIEDAGYDYITQDPRKGLELSEYYGFAVGKTTNYGTIGFGFGTYHIRGLFTNHGIHEVLTGQDLWYLDLINSGEIQSQSPFTVDHTRSPVTKLGSVRGKAGLLLKLSEREDAAEVILKNDIVSEGTILVKAKTFTHNAPLAPYPEQKTGAQPFLLIGNWEFDLHHFTHTGSIRANHLQVIADLFTIGLDEGRIGQIWTVKNPKVGTQNNSFTLIQRKGDLMLPYASLFGEGPVTLTAENGDVIYGNAPLTEPKSSYKAFLPKEPMTFENWKPYHDLCNWHGHYHPYSYAYLGKNGSSLASNSVITINAAPGHRILFAHTHAEGRSLLNLNAPGGDITNLSSRMVFKQTVSVKGRTFTITPSPLLRLYGASQPGNGNCYYTFEDFNQSDRGELISEEKSILFDVDHVLVDASTLAAAQKISNRGKDYKPGPGSSFTSQHRARYFHYKHEYMAAHRHENEWREGQNITHPYAEEPAIIRAGKAIDLIYDLLNHNGTMSADKVTLKGDSLAMKGFLEGLGSWNETPNLPARLQGLYPDLQGLIKAYQDYLAQNNPLLQRQADGSLDYTVPFSDPMGDAREQNRERLPVIDENGEEDEHRRSSSSETDLSLFQTSLKGKPLSKLTKKLLAFKTDPEIRKIVGQEIIQMIETPGSALDLEDRYIGSSSFVEQVKAHQKKMIPVYDRLMAEVKAYNLAYPDTWYTPYEILDLDPERKDPLVEKVFQALEPYEKVLSGLREWARSEEIYQFFIETYVADPAYRLLQRPLQERVKRNQQGVLDALAQLYKQQGSSQTRYLPFYAPGAFDAQAFHEVYSAYTGKNYRREKTRLLIGEEILTRMFLRGLYYQQGGYLRSSGLSEVKEAIAFYRTYSVGSQTPVLVLELYIPSHEKGRDVRGKSAITGGRIEGEFAGSVLLKNASLVTDEDDISLKSKGDMTIEGSDARAQRDLILKAAKELRVASTVSRRGDSDNYKDILTRTFLAAGRNLSLSADTDLVLEGISTESGIRTKLQAGRHLIDKAIALAMQSYWRDGESYERTKTVHQEVSHHRSGGNFVSTARGVQMLYANIIDALSILIEGDQGVYEVDVHDTHEHESVTVTKGDGWFESDSKQTRQSVQATSKGCQHTAQKTITVRSLMGPIDLTNVTYVADETLLESLKSVTLRAGNNYSASVETSSDSNVCWTSQEATKQTHQTLSQSQISGKLKISAPVVNIETIKGQTIQWLDRIELFGATSINFTLMEELHAFESHSSSGPSVALSALIALAATIATQGAATWLSTTMVTAAAVTTATATAVIGGMSSALVASLASRAALALANCNGDFGQAAKSLVSEDAFKDLGISMATAGVLEGVGAHFKLPTKAADCKTGLDHIKRASLQMSINMAVSLGLGKPFEDALKQIGRTGIATMAQGMVANEIGQADLDTVTNKIAHGLVGGVTGILLQNSRDGFLSGASGAAVGAMIANAIQEDPKVTIQRIEDQAKADGKDLRDEKVRKAYVQSEVESQRLVNWSTLGAGIVGLLAKQNVHISIETARTAVENNCAQALAAAVAAGVLKKVSGEAVLAGVAAATAMAGGLLAKKQTEDHLDGTSKREMAPEDVDWKDQGFTQEESKPTVHVTPENDYRPTDQGFEEAPIDLTKGTNEGYQAYDGPDTSVLEKEQVKPYEVGGYREMIDRSKGDKMEIHHAPQQHPANQAIDKYNHKNAPSIALPVREHKKIPNIKGEYEGTARDLMANDARNLRKYTQAPNEAIEELIGLTKLMYPKDFAK